MDLESDCIGPKIIRMRSVQKGMSNNLREPVVAAFRTHIREALSLAEKQRVRQYRQKQMKKGREEPVDTTGEIGVPIN